MAREFVSQEDSGYLTGLNLEPRTNLTELPSGKVRKRFLVENVRGRTSPLLMLVTTDTISIFDNEVGYVPHKGRVLNAMSNHFFGLTEDIIGNHQVANIDPNVVIVEPAKVLAVEFVFRNILSMGTSTTNAGRLYLEGKLEEAYGVSLRPGLKHGDKLDEPILTITTKADTGHDKPITESEILRSGLVTPDVWDQAKKATIALSKRLDDTFTKSGFVLVDGKFEFGLLPDGTLVLIDELGTPDSVGLWYGDYQERLAVGLKPEIAGKEWFRGAVVQETGYRGEGEVPVIPQAIFNEMGRRYLEVCTAVIPDFQIDESPNPGDRITKRIDTWLDENILIR